MRSRRRPATARCEGIGKPSRCCSLEHVTQRFGQLAAVDDLSFEVEEGEVLGIAGPNGAGKTTVFNLISGFLHGSGRILLDGKRVDGLPPHRVTHLGVARTFQIPQPFHSMTVVQNLRIGEHFGSQGDYRASIEPLDRPARADRLRRARGQGSRRSPVSSCTTRSSRFWPRLWLPSPACS